MNFVKVIYILGAAIGLNLSLTGLTVANETQAFMGMQFVKIEPGCFQMGRDKEFKDSSPVELPTHKVCLEKAFYLGETEVTQKQWTEVMGTNPSKFKGLYRPVEKVSWEDVQAFLQKLNAKAGGAFFRLPTEAEWEYAARAGKHAVYAFGDDTDALAQYAWYGNEGYGGTTHDVAQKKANAWGLYDMHGNVWEWVQDWYHENYYQNSPEKDPPGPATGQYRVYRGGSWVGKAFNLRCAVRFSGLPNSRTRDIGFRLVRQM